MTPAADASAREVVSLLLTKVEKDTELPNRVRESARSLRPLASTDPYLAYERLRVISAGVASSLSFHTPRSALARCVGVEVFWAHHLRPEGRAFYPTPEHYRRFLEHLDDPGAQLLADLSDDPVLFPAEHSWLVATTDIQGLDGLATKRALQIRPEPPLIVFVMSLPRLTAGGVTIRAPRAVDAVPAKLTDWTTAGLPSGISEWIDRVIPFSALHRIEWRP